MKRLSVSMNKLVLSMFVVDVFNCMLYSVYIYIFYVSVICVYL